MRRLIYPIFFFLPFGLAAQNYNVASIPDSLKKDARVVVREDELILEIKSPSKAVTKERHVYTVFNESGDSWGGYLSHYDKFNSINSISGTLYDAAGKEIKRIRKKEMEDRSGVGESSLMDDSRYKECNFYYRNYPYTVAFEEEDEYNGLLAFPGWHPLPARGMSTQHSKYVVIAPKDYEVRFKPVNCNLQPVVTSAGDKKIYTWEMSNLSQRQTERAGPSWNEIAPYVRIAPSDFEAQGYKGSMSSWENYGKFVNQLLAGRDVLPENIKQKVHALTDNLKDPHEKVYALYDFLQKNTHYISIQLGIGGWQPFPADYVASKLYGDCKALSNYMVALLKEAGIRGRYVVIYGGADEPELIRDFPSLQGNHVIACVPLEKDTVWLECTSQTTSPGFMGSFTGNRNAILIAEDGAHIVRTPSYSAADNLKSRKIAARITEEGNLEADVNTYYSGESQERPQSLMRNASDEQREKYLNSLFHLPTYKVEKSQYEELRGRMPAIREYLRVVSPNYASVTGKRMFISPNLFDKSNYRLAKDSVRQYEIINDDAFRQIDSITIAIPPGYQAESVPAEVAIDSRFGKYAASVKVTGETIIYYRKWEESTGKFPSSDYQDMAKYYEQLYRSDHSSVVLVKK